MSGAKGLALTLLALTVVLCWAIFAFAFEHEDSPVKFLEYNKVSIELAQKKNKPIFILFSAQWCHWCKAFADKTLSEEKVYTYLNKHYINIFVDFDIRRKLYSGFQARGLPYNVFLEPDGSLFFKYGGMFYADDFLEIIKNVRKDMLVGKAVEGDNEELSGYSPPERLEPANVKLLRQTYVQAALENFDREEYGLGRGDKYIMPETFLYLLGSRDIREEAFPYIYGTLKKAVRRIYDPIEGGFFRYAEKRNWQIPHYEKMIDLNSAAVLLLYKLTAVKPSPDLKKAAEKTTFYLTSKLFDSKTGAFLSFQVADESYYSLGGEKRKKATEPPLVKKIFIDRLAVSLSYFLDTLEYWQDPSYERKIRQSLDFLAKMVVAKGSIYHYYSLSEKRWLNKGNLADHVYLAYTFLKAFSTLKNPVYLHLSKRILREAQLKFYDKKQVIFIDKPEARAIDVEYQMELNGLIALTFLLLPENERDKGQSRIVEGIITYFSGMNGLLEERVWDPDDWQFMERYVPYLKAAEIYLPLT